MRQDRLEVRILAGIDALVVPIARFQPFHQRHDRAMHVPGRVGQVLKPLMVSLIGYMGSFAMGAGG